ncbi:MAG TPA: hypothetical protein VE307_05220 [Nitrososphaeraceae archaeon]|nr:hypothetical protein [Nitrososphaeraceae archaeon]
MVSIIDMTLGMILGMALSPIMMKLIKDFRQRIKVNKILKEYVKNNKKDLDKNNNNNNQI